MEILYLAIGIAIGLVIMGIVLLVVHSNDKKTIDLLSQSIPEKFSAMASDALKNNSSELQRQNLAAQQPINNLVNQLHAEIARMENDRKTEYGSLVTKTGDLAKETQQLNRILGNSQARGNWGETTLERIVELSGMKKYCDYDTQVSVIRPGINIRPDMIVRLPNNRNIIIDSKVPYDAYQNAVTCNDPVLRTQYIEAHDEKIKNHIDQLSKKEYWKQFNSPDFVVLFMPNDQFLAITQEVDPDLLEYAIQKNIVLATPATIYSLLVAVKMGWNENTLTENAKHIAELSNRLSDGINTWFNHLKETGKSLGKAVENYNKSIGSLDRNVIPNIERIRDCGISEAEKIDTEFTPIDKAIRESRFMPESPVDDDTPILIG